MSAARASVLVAALALASSPATLAHAQAEVPVASLAYEVPARCPDRQAFEDLVSARLGYVAFVDDAERAIVVSIRADGDGYEGWLEPSEQRVRGSSCERVSEALGVLVAIAIDPLGEGAAAAAEPPREPLPEALERLDDEPPPTPAPDSTPAPETTKETTGPIPSLRVRLHGSLGLAPSATLGGGVGVALRLDAFSIGGEFLVETTPEGGTAQSVSGTVWRGGLTSCGSMGILSACALLSLGQLHAASDLVSTPSLGSALVGHAGARTGVGFDALGLRWGVELDVVMPFVRPSVRVGAETVWKAPLVAASLALGVHWEPR